MRRLWVLTKDFGRLAILCAFVPSEAIDPLPYLCLRVRPHLSRAEPIRLELFSA